MVERWKRCEATVVDRRIRTSATSAESDYDYVLEVRPRGVAPFSATVDDAGSVPPGGNWLVGDIVEVFYDPDTLAVRAERVAVSSGAHVPTDLGGGVYGSSGVESDASSFPDAALFARRTPDVLATMHTPPGGLSADPGERLVKLQALKEQGFLSEDEYREQRQRLIDTI